MELTVLLHQNVTTVLRILIDVYIFIFARRKARAAEANVEATFNHGSEVLSFFSQDAINSKDLLEAKDIGFHIVSSDPCKIENVRLGILLRNSSLDDKISPYAYIDISGSGAFGTLVLSLPFALQDKNLGGNDVKISLTKDRMGLVLLDLRVDPSPTERFEIGIATPVMFRAHTDWKSIQIEFPIKPQLRTVGQPWMKSDSVPNFKANPGDPQHFHFPSIENMEIALSSLPEKYRFSTTNLVPPPEFRSETECRWISGNSPASRPHSSVFCQIDKVGAEAKMDAMRIRGGFSVGMWFAVLVTVAIDLTWSTVELVGAILEQLPIGD